MLKNINQLTIQKFNFDLRFYIKKQNIELKKNNLVLDIQKNKL